MVSIFQFSFETQPFTLSAQIFTATAQLFSVIATFYVNLGYDCPTKNSSMANFKYKNLCLLIILCASQSNFILYLNQWGVLLVIEKSDLTIAKVCYLCL